MRGLRWFCGAAAALAIGLSAPQAFAYDWMITAHVTLIQPTYLPEYVSFQVDTAGGPCAAGSWLAWPAQGTDEASQIANTQAVYSSLLAAMLAGKSVTLFGNNTGCTVNYVWILK